MSRSIRFLFFLIVVIACDTPGNIKQPGKRYFLKYFGGEGNQTAVQLIVNSDGTFYILGNSVPTAGANQQVYLAHVDALGEVIHQDIYASAATLAAKDFLVEPGGQLVIVANQQTSANNSDVLLLRVTDNGNGFAWSPGVITFAGSSSAGFSEYANSVTRLSNGDFIIEGYLTGDPANPSNPEEMHLRLTNSLVKWSSIPGNVWTEFQAFGSSAYGVKAFPVPADTTSNFYTFLSTNKSLTNGPAIPPSFLNKFWAKIIGSSGSTQTSGKPNSTNETANDVFIVPGYGSSKYLTSVSRASVVANGRFLLAGISESSRTDSLKIAVTNGPLFSFYKNGVYIDEVIWDLGPIQNPNNRFATAYADTISSFYLALSNTYRATNGNTSSTSDILLLKCGNNPLQPAQQLPIQWSNQFGGAGDDTAAAVSELPDGHIIVLGTMQLGNPPTQFKIVLMKLNGGGQLSD